MMDEYKRLLKEIEETINSFKDCEVDKDHPLNWMLDKWIRDIKSPPTKAGSAEWKAKISAALKGRPAHNKGVPMSNEAKVKMSAAAKKRWKKDQKPTAKEDKTK